MGNCCRLLKGTDGCLKAYQALGSRNVLLSGANRVFHGYGSLHTHHESVKSKSLPLDDCRCIVRLNDQFYWRSCIV